MSAGLGASSIRDFANRPFLSPSVSTGSSGDLLLSLDMSYEVLDVYGKLDPRGRRRPNCAGRPCSSARATARAVTCPVLHRQPVAQPAGRALLQAGDDQQYA